MIGEMSLDYIHRHGGYDWLARIQATLSPLAQSAEATCSKCT